MSSRWKIIAERPDLRANLARRGEILRLVRQFFIGRGFVEAETPIVVAVPGMEPHLTPFETTLMAARGAPSSAYLITSPEYSLKKLLAAGFPKLFELARVFRNGEPDDALHNPEFTMLEWYRANADYRTIMDDCEELIVTLSRAVRGEETFSFGESRINLARPWERLTVRDAFLRETGIDFNDIPDRSSLLRAARTRGYDVPDQESFEEIFHRIFLTEVEPRLGRLKPTILYDYPIELAALARTKRDAPRYAERFELYIAGIELANAFSELTDAVEQCGRFEEERRLRLALGRPALPIDEDLLAALPHIPPSGGIALGIDRLVMLLLGAKRIEDVLWFPAATMFNELDPAF